jgi:hypothetical protein
MRQVPRPFEWAKISDPWASRWFWANLSREILSQCTFGRRQYNTSLKTQLAQAQEYQTLGQSLDVKTQMATHGASIQIGISRELHREVKFSTVGNTNQTDAGPTVP